MFYIERFDTEDVPSDKKCYSRVREYTANPYFDAVSKKCSPMDIGQCVAKLLIGSHWGVWVSKEDDTFTIFNTTSDSFKSAYDIDSLEEGKDRFTLYDALAKWSHESGFYDRNMRNSKDKETIVFMEQLGLTGEDGRMCEYDRA